jgi:uncharacterized glyoxalase superfamily protein PhnB
MASPPLPPGSASVQAPLWGARVKDWAELQEPTAQPLFEAILTATGVGPGVSMLDVGCGAGLFCQLAANLGASVSGFDAAAPMIAVARSRVPNGDFRIGDMEELPFADSSFDLVTGVNSFQYAANPVRALAEASRVVKPRGTVVIATLGRREDCETSSYMDALRSLLADSQSGVPGPFAFSSQPALEAAVREAGLHPESFHEVDAPFEYPNLETTLRAMLSSGTAVRAVEASGEGKVMEALTEAVAPFRRRDGSYRLANKYMFLVASRTAVKNYFRPGFRSITPYLIAPDAVRLIDFLKAAFGAHEMLRVPNAQGGVAHAELQIGNSIIELGQASEAWEMMRATLHLYVPDADATYKRALDAGAVSIQEPHNTDYGDRSSGIQDPAGNRWFIATHVGMK